jgi:hypothetical protein
MGFSAYGGGAGGLGSRTPFSRGQFDVHPIFDGGIFSNDFYMTNLSARYRIVDFDALDGEFGWGDGGTFTYTRGAQTGTAWFIYEVLDYNGLGKNSSATVSIEVQ